MWHRNCVHLLAFKQDVIVGCQSVVMVELWMRLLSLEVISGHQVSNHYIVFELCEWSDYSSVNLQMICPH